MLNANITITHLKVDSLSVSINKKAFTVPSWQSSIGLAVLVITFVLTWLIYSNLPIVGDVWAPSIFGQEHGGSLSRVITGYLSGFSNGNPRIGQLWLIFYGYFPGIHAVLFAFAVPTLIWLLGAHIVGYNLKTQFSNVVFSGFAALAIFWFLNKEIGATIFYQATSGNYLFALILLLTFLLPFRMTLGLSLDESTIEQSTMKLDSLRFRFWLVTAFLAGLGHETYGPTVIAGLASAFIVAPRFKVKRERWMVFGWLSFLLGYTALVLAPGQGKRYNSEDRLDSFFVDSGILIDRALDLLELFVASGVWLLAAAAAVSAYRIYWQKLPWHVAIIFLAFIGLGLGISLTGIGAPDGIIGERFVFASHACLAIAICGLILGNSKNIYISLVSVAISGGYLGYEYIQTRQAYALYNQQFNAQTSAIQSALSKGQSEAIVPAYSLPFYKLKKYIFKEFPQTGPNPRVNTFIARYYGIDKISATASEDTRVFGRRMVDKPLRLEFLNCPRDDGQSWQGVTDPLGGLVCEKDYLIYYNSENSNWVVSGFGETPGRTAPLKYAVKRQVGQHPDTGSLRLWGSIKYFSPEGEVLTPKGELWGRLTEPNYTNAIKSGPMTLSLDECGLDDKAEWTGKDDPFGVLICGEDYALIWDKNTLIWTISGLQERANGPPVLTNRQIQGQTPNEGRINLLGGLYNYNSNGDVLNDTGEKIGRITTLVTAKRHEN